jgi:hypothetical protein
VSEPQLKAMTTLHSILVTHKKLPQPFRKLRDFPVRVFPYANIKIVPHRAPALSATNLIARSAQIPYQRTSQGLIFAASIGDSLRNISGFLHLLASIC